jgi:2-dehydropantoate 2-reductase
MRIFVVGAGVIGSVYAGKLLEAGREVALLARGRRLSDLQAHGFGPRGCRVGTAYGGVGACAERTRYG